MKNVLSIVVLGCGVIIAALITAAAFQLTSSGERILSSGRASLNDTLNLDNATAQMIEGEEFSGGSVKAFAQKLLLSGYGMLVVTKNNTDGFYNLDEANDEGSRNFVPEDAVFIGSVARGDNNELLGCRFVEKGVTNPAEFDYSLAESPNNTVLLKIGEGQQVLFEKCHDFQDTLKKVVAANAEWNELLKAEEASNLYKNDSDSDDPTLSEAVKLNEIRALRDKYSAARDFQQSLLDFLNECIRDNFFGVFLTDIMGDDDDVVPPDWNDTPPPEEEEEIALPEESEEPEIEIEVPDDIELPSVEEEEGEDGDEGDFDDSDDEGDGGTEMNDEDDEEDAD